MRSQPRIVVAMSDERLIDEVAFARLRKSPERVVGVLAAIILGADTQLLVKSADVFDDAAAQEYGIGGRLRCDLEARRRLHVHGQSPRR